MMVVLGWLVSVGSSGATTLTTYWPGCALLSIVRLTLKWPLVSGVAVVLAVELVFPVSCLETMLTCNWCGGSQLSPLMVMLSPGLAVLVDALTVTFGATLKVWPEAMPC